MCQIPHLIRRQYVFSFLTALRSNRTSIFTRRLDIEQQTAPMADDLTKHRSLFPQQSQSSDSILSSSNSAVAQPDGPILDRMTIKPTKMDLSLPTYSLGGQEGLETTYQIGPDHWTRSTRCEAGSCARLWCCRFVRHILESERQLFDRIGLRHPQGSNNDFSSTSPTGPTRVNYTSPGPAPTSLACHLSRSYKFAAHHAPCLLWSPNALSYCDCRAWELASGHAMEQYIIWTRWPLAGNPSVLILLMLGTKLTGRQAVTIHIGQNLAEQVHSQLDAHPGGICECC